VDTIVDHIAHIGDLIGIEHVGIGPDFAYGPVAEEHRRSRSYEGVTIDLEVAYPVPDPASIPLLDTALRKRGFSDQEVRGILGDNLFRLLGQVLPSSNA
jgi:membrane dipeptidase